MACYRRTILWEDNQEGLRRTYLDTLAGGDLTQDSLAAYSQAYVRRSHEGLLIGPSVTPLPSLIRGVQERAILLFAFSSTQEAVAIPQPKPTILLADYMSVDVSQVGDVIGTSTEHLRSPYFPAEGGPIYVTGYRLRDAQYSR